MQICRQRKNAVGAGRDSDHIAYGINKVYVIDNWGREEVRVIDMETPLTDEVKEQYPLYAYIKKYGLRVVHFWAAVNGCDITEAESGISGIGKETFFDALRSFESSNGSTVITAESFAGHLLKCAKRPVRSRWNVGEVAESLDFVAKFFVEGGTYYDKDGREYFVNGNIKAQSTAISVEHMTGRRSPRKKALYAPEEVELQAKLDPSNLLHNSIEDSLKTSSCAGLPPGQGGRCRAVMLLN